MTTIGALNVGGAAGVGGAAPAPPGLAAPLSDEARFELAMSAAARERRNRPRMFLVLGAAAIIVAGVAAAMGLKARGAAREILAEERASTVQAERLLKELAAMQQKDLGAGSGHGIGQPYPNLMSRLEELGQQAGLEKAVKKPVDSKQSGGKIPPDVVVRQYDYSNMNDPSLANLLDWVRKACADVPGLEVYGLTLKAEPTGWTFSVTFRRWERTGR